jgi:hypothetical protein
LIWFSFLAVSEILNRSKTFAVPSVRNAVGLLILFKLCPASTFFQQLVTKGLRNTDRPYESCKIFKSWPHRNAFSKLVHRQYKSFPLDRFLSVGNQQHNWVE